MEIHNTRFGTLSFDENEIIHFSDGLLGFPLSSRFVLFPYNDESPFYWMQSVDEPEISFIVINPFEFFNDLEFVLSDSDVLALGLQQPEQAEIFSLVTIPDGRPEDMRTNLAGPLVVNAENRKGRQMLFKGYSTRQQLIPEQLHDKMVREGKERVLNRKSSR